VLSDQRQFIVGARSVAILVSGSSAAGSTGKREG